MRFALRLLTVLSFFLPFVFFVRTCNGPVDWRFSYNQHEADSNLLVSQEAAFADTAFMHYAANDSVRVIDSVDKSVPGSASLSAPQAGDSVVGRTDVRVTFIQKAFMPTNSSLSGLGCLFYFKNIAGIIFLGLCLLAVLILLLAYRFIKSKHTNIYLMLTSLVFLAAFILDSLVSAVTLLWGTWILAGLMLVQLKMELNRTPKYQSHRDSDHHAVNETT